MQCPVDGTTLAMSERSGIEIDYCPECRGVWLDRGELDKIIERATNDDPRADDDRHDDHRHDDHRHGRPDGKPRKKGSFLTNLLDFGE